MPAFGNVGPVIEHNKRLDLFGVVLTKLTRQAVDVSQPREVEALFVSISFTSNIVPGTNSGNSSEKFEFEAVRSGTSRRTGPQRRDT